MNIGQQMAVKLHSSIMVFCNIRSKQSKGNDEPFTEDVMTGMEPFLKIGMGSILGFGAALTHSWDPPRGHILCNCA